MNEQQVGRDPNSVRKVLNVNAPEDVAWRVFTEQIGTWWFSACANQAVPVSSDVRDTELEPVLL